MAAKLKRESPPRKIKEGEEKQYNYNTIEYIIVTLCNATIDLFSAIIDLKH